MEEGTVINGWRMVKRTYTYAATEKEIRALGYTPDDFPHTVLEWATPNEEVRLTAFNATKEEK